MHHINGPAQSKTKPTQPIPIPCAKSFRMDSTSHNSDLDFHHKYGPAAWAFPKFPYTEPPVAHQPFPRHGHEPLLQQDWAVRSHGGPMLLPLAPMDLVEKPSQVKMEPCLSTDLKEPPPGTCQKQTHQALREALSKRRVALPVDKHWNTDAKNYTSGLKMKSENKNDGEYTKCSLNLLFLRCSETICL